jgi:hypothetical protein
MERGAIWERANSSNTTQFRVPLEPIHFPPSFPSITPLFIRVVFGTQLIRNRGEKVTGLGNRWPKKDNLRGKEEN